MGDDKEIVRSVHIRSVSDMYKSMAFVTIYKQIYTNLYTVSSQTKSKHGEGRLNEVSSGPEEILAIDSFWKSESLFYLCVWPLVGQLCYSVKSHI